MTIVSTSIVSALNNYNSIVPIVTKDLVENGGRTAMAYHHAGKETKTYEATEKFIEANAASFLWYGAIPLIKGIFNFTAFKFAKLNPNVSLELLDKAQKVQNVDEIVKKIDLGELPKKIAIKKGLFKKTTELIDTKEILVNIKNNAKAYKGLHVARMITSTAVPAFVSAIVLPKMIMALTQNLVDKKAQIAAKKNNVIDFGCFKNKKVAFKGLADGFVLKAAEAQKSLLGDMVAVDLGISGSRIYYANKREQEALNGRKTNAPYAAALEKLIREGGFLYLIYFGGNHIKNFIDKLTNNKFDPLVLEDKSFVNELKGNKFAVNPLKNLSESDAIKYIDKNIGDDSQVFIKYAKKLNLIKTVMDENGKTLRNPFEYVNVKNLSAAFDTMVESAGDFLKKGGDNLSEYVKHKSNTKRMGVYGNLVASSFAVCYVLPKIVYVFRKWYTGSSEEPGINHVITRANENALAKK